MAHKNQTDKWLDRTLAYLDANFGRFKDIFEIILAISLGIIFTILTILPEGVDLGMTWQFWTMTLFIWVSVFCAVYLIRNSRKEANLRKKREDATITLLLAIAGKLGVDAEEIIAKLEGKTENGNNKSCQ